MHANKCVYQFTRITLSMIILCPFNLKNLPAFFTYFIYFRIFLFLFQYRCRGNKTQKTSSKTMNPCGWYRGWHSHLAFFHCPFLPAALMFESSPPLKIMDPSLNPHIILVTRERSCLSSSCCWPNISTTPELTWHLLHKHAKQGYSLFHYTSMGCDQGSCQ